MTNPARRIPAFALTLGLAALLASCAPALGGGNASDDPRSDQTAVQIENNNWHDIRIYAVLDGVRTRLGTVGSMTKRTLQIPRTLLSGLGELRLLAAPIGPNSRYLSEPVQVSPGQRIEWRLENYLPLSSISVW